jgi:hypothetical protein
MSATPSAAHPVLDALGRVADALVEVREVSPVFMDTATKRLSLEGIAAAEARLAELKLRVMGTASEVAEDSASHDLGAWLAVHTHADLRAARGELRLALVLEERWGSVRAGMADGVISAAQARAVVTALEALPADLPAETIVEAERVLVDLTDRLTPVELVKAGRRVLDLVAPEIAEAALARQLEAEEREAYRKTKLTFRANGDGTTRVDAVVPDATAARLKTYLEAFTSPRQGDKRGTGPYPRVLGQALCALLERIDPDTLPEHGGDATTVIVTIAVESLRKDLGVGDLIGGDALSAAEIRRLACTSNVIPAVLGGTGEVLDQGRARRLFTRAQRKALILRNRTCRAEGCDIPGTWAEAHHWISWTRGGKTDLANAVLLCSHHHHRAHDPGFTADRLPNGDIRFNRRT